MGRHRPKTNLVFGGATRMAIVRLIRLERESEARGLSVHALGIKAAISPNTMTRVRKGLPIQASSVAKIVKALAEIPILPGMEELLTDAGRLNRERSESQAGHRFPGVADVPVGTSDKAG
jgi:hypothetical protein